MNKKWLFLGLVNLIFLLTSCWSSIKEEVRKDFNSAEYKAEIARLEQEFKNLTLDQATIDRLNAVSKELKKEESAEKTPEQIIIKHGFKNKQTYETAMIKFVCLSIMQNDEMIKTWEKLNTDSIVDGISKNNPPEDWFSAKMQEVTKETFKEMFGLLKEASGYALKDFKHLSQFSTPEERELVKKNADTFFQSTSN